MAAAANKTRETGASVAGYLAAIDDEARRKDCKALAALMSKVTHEPAKMWGTAIVGFGSVHYIYDSGREGDICLLGFSSRKAEISVYGTGSSPNKDKLLAKLGKHKAGKGCLYIARLADVELAVLEELMADSVKAKLGAAKPAVANPKPSAKTQPAAKPKRVAKNKPGARKTSGGKK